MVDFCNSNCKNDFDIAIADTSIKTDHIYDGYIYSNINNRWQNPTLQFLFIIGNNKVPNLTSNILITIIIFY